MECGDCAGKDGIQVICHRGFFQSKSSCIVIIRKIIEKLLYVIKVIQDIVPVIISCDFRMCGFDHLKLTANQRYRIAYFM